MGEDRVLLTHGSGGRLTRKLIEEMIVPAFNNPVLRKLEDAAELAETGSRMVITQDSYVITPLFFPGGDIGKLAVCGTINDLATAGAKPVAMSVGLILEEGLFIQDLKKILCSMKKAADSIPVPLIAGDTKVVEKGRGDGVYISTTGVGIVPEEVNISVKRIKPGDAVLINGPVGNHEAAIICARNDFYLEAKIVSDCAPLYRLMQKVIEVVPDVRFARDPTRGGVASILSEIIESSGLGINLREEDIPVDESVAGICDILGMDPLLMANEGKMVIIVPADKAETCLHAMKSLPEGERASIIGEVKSGKPRLTLKTPYGTRRIITMPMGEQLPRIC